MGTGGEEEKTEEGVKSDRRQEATKTGNHRGGLRSMRLGTSDTRGGPVVTSEKWGRGPLGVRVSLGS
ncbi:Hypothetical predicted protein, partial [Marmota monax]